MVHPVEIVTEGETKWPRINVEDKLFKDPRFMDLIAKIGRDAALGAVVQAFIMGQEFFLNEETSRMIPLKEWKKRRLNDLVIETGLAELRDGDLIYICESEIHFNWLLQCQDAGKKSAEKRRSTNPQRPSTPVQPPSTSYSPSYSPSRDIYINKAEEKARRCLEAVKRFGPNDTEELKKFVGDELFNEVRTTITWSGVRSTKLDQWTVKNIASALGGQ